MLLINDLPALPRGLRYATIAAIAVDRAEHLRPDGAAAYTTFMRLSFITVFVLVEIAALVALRLRRAA